MWKPFKKHGHTTQSDINRDFYFETARKGELYGSAAFIKLANDSLMLLMAIFIILKEEILENTANTEHQEPRRLGHPES